MRLGQRNWQCKAKSLFRDFFRWLRDRGYLNPIFWIDGGVVMLLPKDWHGSGFLPTGLVFASLFSVHLELVFIQWADGR